MTARRPRALVASLVAVLAVVVGGCGGTAAGVPELSSLTSVAQSSAAAESARFSVEASITIPGTSKPLAFSAEGGFDTPAKRSQLTVDLSSFAALLQTMGSSLGGTVTGDLGEASDWKLELIQDGDTAYVRFPPLAAQLPDGKTWIKGDANDLSNTDAGQLKQFGSLAGTDPRDVFGLLEAVSGSIESVGTEEIRGVETSHYRAAIDTSKVEQLVPEAKRQSLGGLDQAAKQAGLSDLPLEIWIDADRRVRKLSIDLDAKQPGTDTPVEAALVVELYDYGAPVEPKLPPPDQVADAATLKPS